MSVYLRWASRRWSQVDSQAICLWNLQYRSILCFALPIAGCDYAVLIYCVLQTSCATLEGCSVPFHCILV